MSHISSVVVLKNIGLGLVGFVRSRKSPKSEIVFLLFPFVYHTFVGGVSGVWHRFWAGHRVE